MVPLERDVRVGESPTQNVMVGSPRKFVRTEYSAMVPKGIFAVYQEEDPSASIDIAVAEERIFCIDQPRTEARAMVANAVEKERQGCMAACLDACSDGAMPYMTYDKAVEVGCGAAKCVDAIRARGERKE
jgi:hypothetical protein